MLDTPSYIGDSLPIAASIRASGIPVHVIAVNASKCFFRAPDTPDVRQIVEHYVAGTLKLNPSAFEAARVALVAEIRDALAARRQAEARRV